jgi:spore coat polysaccharide biosynthesis predicted glycosyltransferase SpsG
MRCLALAEGLRDEGLEVLLLGALHGVALAERQVRDHGLEVLPAPDGTAGLMRLLDERSVTSLVVDSYTVPIEQYAAARSSGRPVVAIVDAAAPTLDADLLVNQNLDAERTMSAGHRGRVLAGPAYALLRSAVTRLRPAAAPVAADPAYRVLVVAGGTDVADVAPRAVSLLLGTGRPLHLDVVCTTDGVRQRVSAAATVAGQHVVAHPPVDGLAALAAAADLVVSAAGTTVLELACLGRAMAVVTVADNQETGYAALVAAGAGHGLGPAARLGADERAIAAELGALLDDAHRRTELARNAYALVDGVGRRRVASEVATLLVR